MSAPGNCLGSSRVPTLRMTTPGISGTRLKICVPQFAQNSRVTGVSRSRREKLAGCPVVYPNPLSRNPKIRLGPPPDTYWHSRQ
jgi:hypothetical protein